MALPMSEAGHASVAHERNPPRALTVLALVAAAALIAVGLTGVAFWLITFQWVYFSSLVALVAGALLLFSPLTGPDRA